MEALWDTTLAVLANPHHLSWWETVSGGQFDWGGRLLKVTEALKGSLRMVGNHSQSVKA